MLAWLENQVKGNHMRLMIFAALMSCSNLRVPPHPSVIDCEAVDQHQIAFVAPVVGAALDGLESGWPVMLDRLKGMEGEAALLCAVDAYAEAPHEPTKHDAVRPVVIRNATRTYNAQLYLSKQNEGVTP